jgi:glycosyltransferase involved in cell wall biosynthesis
MSISVIIPVYNAEKYIAKCLETLIEAKKNLDLEVVLINDGSIDASLEICEEYTRRYTFISVFSQVNMGPSFARNKGIEKATGDFLVFVDADDYVHEYYFAELYNSIKQNDSDLACCGYFDHSKYGTFEATNYGNELSFYGLRNFVPYVLDKVGGVVWDKIFKREIITKNKIIFNTDIRLSEDLLFVLEYLKYINKISIVQKPLYYYNRLDQTGLSKNCTLEQFDAILNVNEKILDLMLYFQGNLSLVKRSLNKRKYSFLIQFCHQIAIDRNTYRYKINMLRDFRLHNEYEFNSIKKNIRWIEYPIVFFLNFKSYSLVLFYCKFLNRIKLILKK